ncbi:hypothetical protein BGZ67_005661 [Mortierella alpina]|nr:hypothetical protein BGZ67_005661 [Mortierella alpina]
MWRPKAGLEASTSRQPASRPTSGGLLRHSNKEWSQNEAMEKITQASLLQLEKLSALLGSEAHIMRDSLEFFGIRQKELAKDKQEILSKLSDLALVLGLSDMSLSSFHQGLAQVRLDTLESKQEQALKQRRLASLKSHRVEAQTKLDKLVGLKRQWTYERESVGDLEQRTRRRSTELNKIKAAEDRAVLEDVLAARQRPHKKSRPSAKDPKGAGSTDVAVDVEACGLTMAQLDLKEKSVEELQQLCNAQITSLAAYQEIPPDYALARLKVKEAMMRLEELTLEHETLATQLAEDL